MVTRVFINVWAVFRNVFFEFYVENVAENRADVSWTPFFFARPRTEWCGWTRRLYNNVLIEITIECWKCVFYRLFNKARVVICVRKWKRLRTSVGSRNFMKNKRARMHKEFRVARIHVSLLFLNIDGFFMWNK